jgi:tRNA-modifying protein YgfZ
MAVVLPRSFIRAAGPDASVYLQSMVSNDVEAVAAGAGTYALLLTPKARVIADLEVFNTGEELILGAPPETAEAVLETLIRARFRKKVELEPVERWLVWGSDDEALASFETPAGTLRLLDHAPADPEPEERYEIARIEAGMPRFGLEFGTESMPAEAGLEERAISFTKGCYPGQEPVARLHYRGHANRGVRGLDLGSAAPEPGAPVLAGDREVGRLTSIVRSPRFGTIGLGILRREVEDGVTVNVAGADAVVRPLPFAP